MDDLIKSLTADAMIVVVIAPMFWWLCLEAMRIVKLLNKDKDRIIKQETAKLRQIQH